MRRIKDFVEDFWLNHPLWFYVSIVLLVFLIIGLFDTMYYSNYHDITVTVTDKERITQSNGKGFNSYYCIYGEDEEGETVVLKIKDVWVKGKFNSSDLYQQIKEGKTYTFNVAGYRIRLFSEYPNIFSFEEVRD